MCASCDEIRTATRLSAKCIRYGRRWRSPWTGYRPAQIRCVPVTAHHCGRGLVCGAASADPYLRHAPHRRIRHRRALSEAKGRNGVFIRAAAGDRRHGLMSAADWQREAADPGEFSESLCWATPVVQGDFFSTWRRRSMPPNRLTPVGLRLRCNTEVGHRCIGARVNGHRALKRKLHRRRLSRFSRPRRRTPAAAGLAAVRGVAARKDEDPPVVRQGAA